MRLRKLVVDDAFDMAIESGCEIRLIPRDPSRFDEIMLEFAYGDIHLSYANGIGSLTIYKTKLWEFEKELEQQFDLDTEDWVVSSVRTRGDDLSYWHGMDALTDREKMLVRNLPELGFNYLQEVGE